MPKRTFETANAETRARLAALLGRLGPADLRVDLGGGWNVASALAHVAFWDRFQAARWRAALEAGQGPAEISETVDSFINAGLDRMVRVVSPDLAGPEVLAAAEALDQLIESLPDEAVADAQAHGLGYIVDRTGHRTEHIDQIERGLARS